MSLVSGRVSVERWLSRLSGSLRQNGVILFGTGKGLDVILILGAAFNSTGVDKHLSHACVGTLEF